MPLRVLQICEATSAGVGRHAIDLMEGLLQSSCEVHLLYSEARIDDEFRRGLRSLAGLHSQVLEMHRKPHPRDSLAVAAVRRYIRQHGPFDAVHGQSSKGGAIARIAGAMTGTPVIYTPHCIVTMAPTFGRLAHRVFRWAEWMLAFPTHTIIAVSQDECDHIRGLGVPASKLRVIHNGIKPLTHTDQKSIRQSLGIASDAVVVGFVGRFSAQKNPELLLESFAAASSDPQVQLALIGSGELESAVKSLAKRLGIDERIHWLGYRNGYECMPAFDVLAIPSRYEGLPYVMLEGLSAGIPMVITNVGGVEGVIHDGENGFVVPADDAASMTIALRKLLESTSLRERMSTAARATAVEFSTANMVRRTLEIYQQCQLRRRAQLAASTKQSQ